MRRSWFIVVSTAVAAGFSARADWRDDIGDTRLHQTFTSGVPTALAAGVTQVEAGYTANGYYLPDAADLQFTGKTFTDKSTNKIAGASWHATNVGYYFYGSSSSLIPGTTAVDVFTANDWINFIPLTESRRIQNHSWIADGLTAANVTLIDARLDYMVQTSGFVCVVGVNNGSSTSTVLPQLLCQGYNQISVGLTNGNHTAGFTAYDGVGRIKPDLVAPDPNYTSFSTPRVSSAAGLLAEKLTSAPYSLTGANIPLTVKSLLLTGATKEEFPAWARTTARPLDLRHGAGELNVLLAYQTLLAGVVTASNTQLRPETAWANASVRSSTAASARTFYFEIPTSSSATRFAATLIWHRPVTQTNLTLNNTPGPANLDLTLYSVASGSFTLGSAIDTSSSSVDNVEHIYQIDLAPGRYALQVASSSSTNTAYALAWRTLPTVTIATTAAEARELDGTQGQFTLTRTGPTTTPLYVPLVIGGTAASTTHYTALPSGVLIPAGASTATIQVVPVTDDIAQGDRTVTLTIATDFSLSAGTQDNATVTLKDKPYDEWRFGYFSTSELADTAISGSSADPDADGFSTLLEYAYGTEPLINDSPSTPLSLARGPDDHLSLTYFQATGRTDLTYTPEWTDDLSTPWQSSATYLSETSRTATSGGEIVTVRAETPLSTAPAQFLRLHVTRP